ncbi:MAG TPA: hypothetical protein PLF03_05980 [Candidatus Omnitrophota bacterium]|nr:hypothetical protein [Candidatus Omnitrophota bacterium]
MCKRLFFVLCICATILSLSTLAFAKNPNSNGADNGGGNGIVDIFMTSDYDVFTPQPSFHEDETPWLYLKLQDSVTQVTGNWWFWNKGNQDWAASFDTANLDPLVWESHSSDNSDGTKNLWLTRLDIDDAVAHDQWWHINNVHTSCPNGGGSTKYHVTPEPISSLLFLIGSGAMFAGARMRKNRA